MAAGIERWESCRRLKDNDYILELLMIEGQERKLNKEKEKNGDGDGVSQSPGRKQIAHSSGVTKESFVMGVFTV